MKRNLLAALVFGPEVKLLPPDNLALSFGSAALSVAGSSAATAKRTSSPAAGGVRS